MINLCTYILPFILKIMNLLTRKAGIWIMIIGLLIMIPINILLIEFVNENIDVDIPGLFIVIIGLIITITRWKK